MTTVHGECGCKFKVQKSYIDKYRWDNLKSYIDTECISICANHRKDVHNEMISDLKDRQARQLKEAMEMKIGND